MIGLLCESTAGINLDHFVTGCDDGSGFNQVVFLAMAVSLVAVPD